MYMMSSVYFKAIGSRIRMEGDKSNSSTGTETFYGTIFYLLLLFFSPFYLTTGMNMNGYL